MKKLENIHPGEVLLEEFMKPLKITVHRLSKDLGIPQTRVSGILTIPDLPASLQWYLS